MLAAIKVVNYILKNYLTPLTIILKKDLMVK